ncbi:MAG: hypothetical protein WAN93_05800 [Solirubrobacteraceae bacterium]
MYWHYPVLFTLLAFAVVAPFGCFVWITTGHGPLAHGGSDTAEATIVTILTFSLVTPLVSALHARAISIIVTKELVSARRVVVGSIGVLQVVFVTVLVANVAIGVGMIAFILPGVILWMRWAVVAQTAAIEGKGLLETLRRCARLTYGCYLHIFLLLLMVGAFLVVVNRAAEALPLGSSSGFASVVVGIAVHTFVASLTALSGAVLYFDLRAREGDAKASVREYHYVRDLD